MLNFWTKRWLIQLNYKSGISTQIWVTKYTVNHVEGRELTKVEYIPYGTKYLLFMGVGDIESIVLLKTRGFIDVQ